MIFGIVTFPGSNCDHDCYSVVKHSLQQKAVYIWHKERDLHGADCLILPGGFSYGDYLRTGAIARFAPVMEEVVKFARAGGTVLGICNGFQILLEAGLLPGAMLRNKTLKFVCKNVYLKSENTDAPFTAGYAPGAVVRMPIAHGEGNYFADDETLERLEGEGRVAFRYSTRDGRITEEANPNGSRNNIAGILNQHKNVLGMMPHPERCVDPVLGNSDGEALFRSMVEYAMAKA